jgi:hypothetical protein
MSRRPPALALVALAAAAALAGCGGEEKLDMGDVETGIERGIEKDNPRTDVVSVDCPDDVEQKKGVSFKCTVRGADGQEAEATVTQVNDDGRVRYVVP